MSSNDSKLSKAKPYAAVSLAEDQLLAARKSSHQHSASSHTTSEDDETTAILAKFVLFESSIAGELKHCTSLLTRSHQYAC
jgi:hypothetical protein